MAFDPETCKYKHEQVEREFNSVWKRLNGQDKKLWAILIVLITQLATIIGILMAAWGKSLIVY